MQVEGREETLKKGSSFLFRELFLLFLRNAKSCIKFQYSCYGEAGNPFVAACGEHECTCQYQCQCTEYLLNAQSAERFAFCPERSVDLGQCHKACPDGIYLRCIHPSGDKDGGSYESHHGAYGEKCGYQLFHSSSSNT